jgi:alpha-L-fucosidase
MFFLLTSNCVALVSNELQKYIDESLSEIDEVNTKGPVKQTSQSLVMSEVPEWFLDAKLGAYSHWGVYVIPGYANEWYSRNMYLQGTDEYQHHIQKYGRQDKFGYKDFIPMLVGDYFNANEWADLYKKAGVKFAGTVAEHHDGFSMWDSKINRWNAALMGPKRDVVGELVAAFRERGMKIVLTLHHSAHFTLNDKRNPDGKPGFFPALSNADTSDIRYADLYGKWENPEDAYRQWLVKTKEVIDGYHPEQLWFDFDLYSIPVEYKLKMGAYYYNRSAEWDMEGLICRKRGFNVFQPGTVVRDFERGGVKTVLMMPWQTDNSICDYSWCWLEGYMQIKSGKTLVHELIDTVSKNGIMLLNVSPDRNGKIPLEQQQSMLEMGQWLDVNGEAVYGTRPWVLHGEGSNVFKLIYDSQSYGRKYTDYIYQDIRYTRSKDKQSLYLITMGWPEEPIIPKAFTVLSQKKSASICLIGYDKPIQFDKNKQGQLTIYPPSLSRAERPCDYAYVFKLTGFEFSTENNVYKQPHSDVVVLFAEDASFTGKSIKMIPHKTERAYLENWSNPNDEIQWVFQIDQPGSYMLLIDMATEKAGNCIGYEVQSMSEMISQSECRILTGIGLSRPWSYELNYVQFKKPGQYKLVLRANSKTNWQPIRIWQAIFSKR